MVSISQFRGSPTFAYSFRRFAVHFAQYQFAVSHFATDTRINNLDLNNIYQWKIWTVKEGLRSLEERRNRADILAVYKMYNGIPAVPFGVCLKLAATLRQEGITWSWLNIEKCRLDMRKFFFSERVVDRWNSLDQNTIASNQITISRTVWIDGRTSRKTFLWIHDPPSLMASSA